MYRISKMSDKYYAVCIKGLDNSRTCEDITTLVESGEPVILVDHIEDVEEFEISIDAIEVIQ